MDPYTNHTGSQRNEFSASIALYLHTLQIKREAIIRNLAVRKTTQKQCNSIVI